MTLIEIVTKITFCLLLAALLGFVVGWLFNKLQKEEKLERKYGALYEDYEIKASEIKQLQEELALKEEHMEQLRQQYQECEKERLNTQLSETDCDRYLSQIKELTSENEMLTAQIKEQKLCEDENALLKDEIRVLEDEKERLLDKLENIKEYEENYKKLIAEVESLKAQNEKLRQGLLSQERIFVPTTDADAIPKQSLDEIKKSLLQLKEKVKRIKEEKRKLKNERNRLKKRLAKKNSALQQCYKNLQEQQQATSASSPETTHAQDKEIKSLSELIRDTLDDIEA